MTLTTGTRLGPYEILAPLGAGGMGEVWKAKDTRLDRFVAVKVLPEHLAKHPESLARFEREAKAVAALNHPNITGIFDIGRVDDTAYAVMELLEGESLRTRLDSGPLAPRKATELAIQMAQGLAAAHEKGVVHRDLKPDNLWITKEGRLKILDFGLAKQMTGMKASSDSFVPTAAISPGHHTEKGMILGTLGYMSPEQVRGESVDARSDIFSFGAVLFEMLTGKKAFARDTASDTMAAILRDDPPEMSAGSRPVPSGLQPVILHCLEKNPAHRFHDAHDLAFALATLSSGSGDAVRNAALGSSWNRRAAVAGALLAMMLLAGGALGGWASRGGPPPPPTFRKLTFGRGTIDGARFVPGSRDIAYSARWQGNPSTVYLLRVGSVEPRALEARGAMLLAASPQGNTAVLTQAALNSGLFEGSLSLLPLAGGGLREISQGAEAADFSSDGASLCLVVSGGSNFQLEWPQGEAIFRSTRLIQSPRIRDARVAFFHSTPSNYSDGEICVLAKGGKPDILARCEGFTGLAWGSGGKEIWFSTYDGNGSRIQAVTLKGQTRLLAHHPGRLDLLDVDASGRCLAIAHNQQRQAFGRTPGALRDTDLTWLDAQKPMAISPDGSQILLTRAGDWGMSSQVGLYLRSLAGGPAVRLGTGSVDADLSHDGRWVATFESDGKGQPGLRLIPTRTGASHWYPVNGVAANADAVWFHPSGASVYLAAEDTNTVSRLDLATGTLTPLPLPLGFSAYLRPFSPDGSKTLLQDVGTSRPADLLFPYLIFKGDNQQPIPAKGNLNSEVAAAWSDNNREVYLYDRNVIPVPVVRWDPLTGNRRPFLQITPPDPAGVWGIYDLLITPSGHAYAYSLVRKLSDLYLIEGLK